MGMKYLHLENPRAAQWVILLLNLGPTGDGSNPAPVDMENIPLFIGFHIQQVVSRISSINGSWWFPNLFGGFLLRDLGKM